MPVESPPLLDCQRLSVRFGGVTAISGLDLQLDEHELIGMVGPNGAGKTTVFNAITGTCRIYSGRLLFFGQAINGWSPHHINSLGIARTFQNIRLFRGLTAIDNIRVALHNRQRYGVLAALFRTKTMRRIERSIDAQSTALLDEVGLSKRANAPAGVLSYGEQRKLEIARALATQPRLLLLDEPAAGMNEGEKVELAAMIRRLHAAHRCAILLIEHDMKFVASVCPSLLVMVKGSILARGITAGVLSDPMVIAAYVGESSGA